MITLRSALLLSVCFCSTPLYADDIFVITHQQSSFAKLTPKLIENIFLKKTFLNDAGNTWIPLNLDPNHPIRIAFSLALFKKKPEDLEAYWNEQYFQGITPPYVVASEDAMLRFVSTTQNAIGYALPCHITDQVHVIFKVNSPLSLKQFCQKNL